MTSLVELLTAKGLFLATAESLTGGLLSSMIVSEAGASQVFLGGVVSYQDATKSRLLGVSPNLLESQGAVDPEVAAQMAAGVRIKLANANGKPEELVIGISTTGVAGPDSVGDKQPGLVYIAISSRLGTVVFEREFQGDRTAIRNLTAEAAIVLLREQIHSL